MNEPRFWELIANHVALDAQLRPTLQPLQDHLASLEAEEIIAFDRIFVEHYYRSYSWDLWGAAYLIRGGCSDDSFDYFRGWLIAQGQAVFEQVLANPDHLATLTVLDDVECEDMLYVAQVAYETATGGKKLPATSQSYPELGDEWDFDDPEQMRSRFPRLFAKFGS